MRSALTMEVSRFARRCHSVLSQAPSPTGHNAEVTNALRHISDEDFPNLSPHITDRVIEAFTYIPVTLLVIGSVHPVSAPATSASGAASVDERAMLLGSSLS
jgi:hypothetical protein